MLTHSLARRAGIGRAGIAALLLDAGYLHRLVREGLTGYGQASVGANSLAARRVVCFLVFVQPRTEVAISTPSPEPHRW